MATYELSFAGTPLTVPTAEVLAWIEAQFGSAGLRPPGPPGWPATKLAGLSSFGWPARFRCRVGSLYWPRGISRFAVGHFLASTDQLNDIYAAMPAGEAATLVLDTGDERGKVSTSMSMLPARPLAAFEGYSDTKGLYLLTLVDARYWLWGKWTTDAVTVTDDTTPWGDMVAAAALDLGITLTHDTVSTTGWGYAPNGLDLAGEPAPLVLDAVCYACGLRVARKLDGSYEARNCDTDRTTVRTNLGGLAAVRMSGGAFSLDRGDLPPGIDTVDDQPLALPETVRLVVLADDGLHTADKPFKPLDPLFEAVRTGVVRAWAVNWQTYDATAAGDYVGALGRAEGVRALAAVSRRFAGVVPWAPEGVSEAVEWVYRCDDACTVIHPAAWNDGVMEVVGIPDGSGSGSVAMVRISGRPKRRGGVRHYPGFPRDLDDTPAWSDEADPVWVVNEVGALLGTTGDFVVTALLDGSTTVGGETRPRYRTTDRIVMADFDCATQTGTYTGLFEGDAAEDGFWADGMFPVGMFPAGMFP